MGDIIALHLSIYDQTLNGVGKALQFKHMDDEKQCKTEIDRQKYSIFQEFCDEIGHNKEESKIGKDGGFMKIVLSENEQLSADACNDFLNNGYKNDIAPMLEDAECSKDDLLAKFKQLKGAYHDECKGPSKDKCWQQFENDKQGSAIAQFNKFQ